MPELVGRFERHELPDGSVVFYDPDPRHRYYTSIRPTDDGWSAIESSRLLGISTVAKGLDDGNVDGLLHWAARLDQTGIAELFREKMEHRGVSYATEWLGSQDAIQAELKRSKLTWSDIRDRAGQRGTDVHTRIFLALSRDENPPSLAELNQADRCFGQAAIRWWRDRRPEPILAEQVTVDQKLGVAGRFDLLAKLGPDRVLIDAKTRAKPRDRRSDHVQLQGYDHCNRECGILGSDAQMVLVLLPDGTYREVWCAGEPEDFQLAVYAWRRGQSLEQRMRQPQSELRATA